MTEVSYKRSDNNRSDGSRADGPRTHRADRRFHLLGGGIASFAADAFLICDGDIQGYRTTIFEVSDRIGGTIDGAGSSDEGYVFCGERLIGCSIRSAQPAQSLLGLKRGRRRSTTADSIRARCSKRSARCTALMSNGRHGDE